MKRHRFLNFSIDSTRNIFKGVSSPLLERYKEEHRDYIKQKYGELNFDAKFDRWLSIPKPVLSVVAEHTHLLQDIENSYVLGSLYSALTGACCLGERIFNQIIFAIKESYRSDSLYKKIYNKGSIVDWKLGIDILVSWKVISSDTEKKYRRLASLRNESVHFQNYAQDLSAMAKEAIELINQIISDLFEISPEKKFISWCEVPGEIYLRKDAENIPFIKAFYIPCAPLVGFKHTITSSPPAFQMQVEDGEMYENTDISDEEFVRLRNEYTKKVEQ